MKYKLINEINSKYNAAQQILSNRGIPESEFFHYLNTTDKDIIAAEDLGIENLNAGACALVKAIQNNAKILIIADCDADGFTSSTILLNYLHDLFPTFVENNIDYYIHEGKQHGLGDCIDKALEYDMVIVPDARK